MRDVGAAGAAGAAGAGGSPGVSVGLYEQIVGVLAQAGVTPAVGLASSLLTLVEEAIDEAYLTDEQCLALLPQLSNVQSLGQWCRKHRVRRATLARAVDVHAAAAVGDRRLQRANRRRS